MQLLSLSIPCGAEQVPRLQLVLSARQLTLQPELWGAHIARITIYGAQKS